MLGYIYSIQTTEWAILIYGLVMIFFLYMYVCFASAVYIPELWPTHLRCAVRVSLMPSDGSSQSSRPMALRHY